MTMMALVLVALGLSALVWRMRVRRSGRDDWFDAFEQDTMYMFARIWHRCAPPASVSPLPSRGPAIVIANHASHADPAFLMACSNRVLHFLQARECYNVPLLRWLFARAGCIPVARARSDVGGIRQALTRLKQGEVIALFPEGEVVGPRGALGPGKPGAALLALRSGAPVFPAWIEGGPEPRSPVQDWLRPSRGVTVRFGPAIDLDAYRDQPPTHQVLQAATDQLMHSLARLHRRDEEPPCASHP